MSVQQYSVNTVILEVAQSSRGCVSEKDGMWSGVCTHIQYSTVQYSTYIQPSGRHEQRTA